MVNNRFVFGSNEVIYKRAQSDPQVKNQGLMAFEIDLQLNIFPVD